MAFMKERDDIMDQLKRIESKKVGSPSSGGGNTSEKAPGKWKEV